MKATSQTPISSIFYYQKRLMKGGKPVQTDDGTGFKTNDNYISFMQVISAYWETVDEVANKRQLIVFMNGGSLLKGQNGELISKAGYTITFPEFLGDRFIQQWYDWSCVFGLTTMMVQPAAPVSVNRAERTERKNHRSAPREEEFVNPAEYESADAAVTIEEN